MKKTSRVGVAWIAQKSMVFDFIRHVLGSNPKADHTPGVFWLPLVEG